MQVFLNSKRRIAISISLSIDIHRYRYIFKNQDGKENNEPSSSDGLNFTQAMVLKEA